MSVYVMVICLFARLLNIYPCSYILNTFCGCNIDFKKQFTMWFSGPNLNHIVGFSGPNLHNPTHCTEK